MDKKRADLIIEDYIRPIYGFALNKMRDLDEAEELAGRITLEVYQVLCHKEHIVDLNSYVFKVAHNVWAKYVREKMGKKCEIELQEEGVVKDWKTLDDSYIDKETEGILRREVAYLSKQQRDIVVGYYYKEMKIKEIAKALNLSEGTVKWNLFEAKKELKSGMKAIRSIGNLGVNPIRFYEMIHSGSPGEKGDTKDFLKKIITQNIAYAAYHKPQTIREIAQELGISPVFIEDEVRVLEEYGFMELLPGGRYRTQILIEEPSAEEEEALHEVNMNYASKLYEHYYKQYLDLEDAINEIGLYYPEEDFNFLLWALISYSTEALVFEEDWKIAREEVAIHRKDGGCYIAMATIKHHTQTCFDPMKYRCMEMIRADDGENSMNVVGWQMTTWHSGRGFDWRDNLYSDYESLAYFVQGKLMENEVTQKIYSRLLEKEYLIQTDQGYKLNVVYMNKEQKEALEALIPRPSKQVRKLSLEYEEKIYAMRKIGIPVHMHRTLRYLLQGAMMRLFPYVFDQMLERGVLKMPKEHQRKALSTLLYIEKGGSYG